MEFEKPRIRENNKTKWQGICKSPVEGLTEDVTYEVNEAQRTDAINRPVQVRNDYGQDVVVFASRFQEV